MALPGPVTPTCAVGFAQAVLDNVPEEIRPQVAYALELAAASHPSAENELLEALRRINVVASPDGTRTFDDTIRALDWITDHARLAIGRAEARA